MKDSDLVICNYENDVCLCQSYKGTETHRVTKDPTSNAVALPAKCSKTGNDRNSLVASKRTYVFTRALVPPNDAKANPVVVGTPMNFIWSVGQSDTIQHHIDRGAFEATITRNRL
jgi:hypothetical protein